MKGLLKINQVADFIAANSTGQCCERQAWNYVNRNPKIICKVKRGHFSYFKRSQVKRLCAAINAGKAMR